MSTVVYQEGFNLIVRTRERSHKHLPHCHAVGGGCEARIVIATGEVLSNAGFSRNDMKKIQSAVAHYRNQLMEKWEEYHGKK